MSDRQAEVLKVTWNWRAATLRQADQTNHLRRSALIQAVVMGVIAALLIHVADHLLAGRIVASLAVLILMLGLFAPAVYRPIHGFGQRLGRGVGSILVYLLLVPFFFLFFTPAALLLRLLGRDPLSRRFRDAQWTYWVDRQARPRGYNIRKQFLHEDRAARAAWREVGSHPVREAEDQR